LKIIYLLIEMNILLSFGLLLAMTISSRGSTLANYDINKVCSRIIIGAHNLININAPFIDVCHNDIASETLYTLHTIDGPNLKLSNAKDPTWRTGLFYPDISVDNCYKQLEQNKTLDIILGSQQQREQFIRPSKDMFFARGHLTPKVDGVTDDEQQATFYFVNAIPQWHVINRGNWQELEKVVRALAMNNKIVLKVYTGAYGVTTLPDDKGIYKPIYLGKDRSGNLMNVLPAPKLMYKVIINENVGTGVAVVTINNPHEYKPAENLCTDVCKQISWITFKIDNITAGYTYCCEVKQLYHALPMLSRFPDPGNLRLMV